MSGSFHRAFATHPARSTLRGIDTMNLPTIVLAVTLLALAGACQLPAGPYVDPTAPLLACSPTGDGGQLCRDLHAPSPFGPYGDPQGRGRRS